MPATLRNLDFGRKTYRAQYAGACISCGRAILPGDHIFYVPENDGPSGADCCADKPDDELVVKRTNDDIHTDDNGDPAARIALVMPRGKTASDMCRKCFMIHSPGQSGCDW